jgi:hypothetical protein
MRTLLRERKHRINTEWGPAVISIRNDPARESAAHAISKPPALANARLVLHARREELERHLAKRHDNFLEVHTVGRHKREAPRRQILANNLPKLRLARQANPIERRQQLLAIELLPIRGTLLGGCALIAGERLFGFNQVVHK